MSETVIVRLRRATADRLRRLAADDGLSVADLVARLTSDEENRRQLSSMNESFAALSQDEVEWARFQAETALWDATSGDRGAGLHGE